MRRLWVQQTLAFGLVVIVTMGAVVVWINRSAVTEFRKYVTLREMRVSGSGVRELVEYHRQRGSWEGVESLLAQGVYVGRDLRGIHLDLGAMLAEIDLEMEKPFDVLLADADGMVVFDSTGRATGQPLGSEREHVWPLTETDDREAIGYLALFYPYTAPLDKQEQGFLDRVEYLLLVNTVVAVGLIVILGALLSRRLSAPLQRLADAARAVAGGDLEHQVETGGSVEVAQVSEAFNEMTAALQEAETLRQNMVADVAHELRTPLSVLQGNLWAILNDAYPLEKAEISRLYDETRLLSRLVEDLRELALADAGELNLELGPTDVVRVIHHTGDSLALPAEAQEVNLSAELRGDLPPVQADPDRVAQVLCNLLLNALQHTPPGGAVTVSAVAKAGEVEITVADTGEGIAPEDLPHVFERFWRADPARVRSGEERFAGGSGLGLSVAQSLVKVMGGRIWAESTLGEGTIFRFTLPRVRDAQ